MLLFNNYKTTFKALNFNCIRVVSFLERRAYDMSWFGINMTEPKSKFRDLGCELVTHCPPSAADSPVIAHSKVRRPSTAV